ncbi:FtsB/FtsL family cell division protein [Fundidesulfovibrio putealis]|uniref:hypothetical protein n=1 Tax=Fundidesulfovibrio putealis TaxID=270496 RepID=UPI00041DF6D9|nr:hypothetical protein [Fundidesulfovibrio putealis]
MKGVTKEWALTLGFSVLTLLALGLGLTWVNIERVDMAYELKRIQTEIDSQEALISKLEVERNTLLTPERLRILATQYGLTQARPGQIRRLSLAGEELASPFIKAAPPGMEKPAKQKAEAVKASEQKGKKGQKDQKQQASQKTAEASGAEPAKDVKKAAADEKAAPVKNRKPVPLDAAPGTDSKKDSRVDGEPAKERKKTT